MPAPSSTRLPACRARRRELRRTRRRCARQKTSSRVSTPSDGQCGRRARSAAQAPAQRDPAGRPELAGQLRIPGVGRVTAAFAEAAEPTHGMFSARKDCKDLWHGGKIQPQHHRRIGLPDQETSAVRRKTSDDAEFAPGAAEPVPIILRAGVKIIVAVCSTKAEATRLPSALRLRKALSQSPMRTAKTSSYSAFHPSSIRIIDGAPSSRSSIRWNRYIMSGGAHRAVLRPGPLR